MAVGRGWPGNGFGGGIPSLHKLTGGLLKNHKAMTSRSKVGQGVFSDPGGSDCVEPNLERLAKAPFFKPAKPTCPYADTAPVTACEATFQG